MIARERSSQQAPTIFTSATDADDQSDVRFYRPLEPAQRHAPSAYRSHASKWWQLHCRLELERPPAFDLGGIGADRFYRFLERSWMAQQLPIACLLFLTGGWGWVAWGVCMRVTASVTGHWFVGHLAHRRGPQSWLVNGAGVQAHDVPWAVIPTMGEAWHNNHHAFPGSAKIGLHPGQSDWGYAFIRLLERLGLAWDIVLPEHLGRAGTLTPMVGNAAPAAHGASDQTPWVTRTGIPAKSSSATARI